MKGRTDVQPRATVPSLAALLDFRRAVETCVERASALASAEDFPSALVEIDAALAIDPGNGPALLLRADIDRRQTGRADGKPASLPRVLPPDRAASTKETAGGAAKGEPIGCSPYPDTRPAQSTDALRQRHLEARRQEEADELRRRESEVWQRQTIEQRALERRAANRLKFARAALDEGRFDQALVALEEIRVIAPDAPDLPALFDRVATARPTPSLPVEQADPGASAPGCSPSRTAIGEGDISPNIRSQPGSQEPTESGAPSAQPVLAGPIDDLHWSQLQAIERRAKELRIATKLATARQALDQDRLEDAAAALREVHELDREAPGLGELAARMEETQSRPLHLQVPREAPARGRSRWLVPVTTFAASAAAALAWFISAGAPPPDGQIAAPTAHTEAPRDGMRSPDTPTDRAVPAPSDRIVGGDVSSGFTDASSAASSRIAGVPVQLDEQAREILVTARTDYAQGRRLEALSNVMLGLRLRPDNLGLLQFLEGALSDAELATSRERESALRTGRTESVALYRDAQSLEQESERYLRTGQKDLAIRSLWSAADSYARIRTAATSGAAPSFETPAEVLVTDAASGPSPARDWPVKTADLGALPLTPAESPPILPPASPARGAVSSSSVVSPPAAAPRPSSDPGSVAPAPIGLPPPSLPAAAPAPASSSGIDDRPGAAAPSSAITALKPSGDDRHDTVETEVRAVLRQYQTAYQQLNAAHVREVWPSVDAKALARAFQALSSQDLVFESCDIATAGSSALVSCRGRARYVRSVGSKDVQVEPRRWTFTLRKAGEAWRIEKADSRR